VGGAWPVLIALTPASERPWVSGTNDNSIWSLMIGYNGLGRLSGQAGGPGSAGPGAGVGGQGGGIRQTVFGGTPGPGRLLDHALGGQAGWLLGFALVAGIGVAVATRLRRGDPRTGWVIAIGGSFATIAIAFSHAQGIFHPYYVSLLAPFTALLVGAGAALALRARQPARIVGPVALVAGGLCSVAILNDHPEELRWLPIVLITGLAAAAVLLGTLDHGGARAAVLTGSIGLLLIAPAVWSYQTLGYPTNGIFPEGGPQSQTIGGLRSAGAGGFGGADAPGFGTGLDVNRSIERALRYTRTHGGGTLAVARQTGAARAILQSGADIAGIGGFSGRESEPTISWFAGVVEQGRITWVQTTAGSGLNRPGGRIGSKPVMRAVQRVGTKTPMKGLYKVSGKAAALRALQ